MINFNNWHKKKFNLALKVFNVTLLTHLFVWFIKVQFLKHLVENLDCDEVIHNLIKIATYMLNANEMRYTFPFNFLTSSFKYQRFHCVTLPFSWTSILKSFMI